MRRLIEGKPQMGTMLKIKFTHHKEATNKKSVKKIYLGDYKKIFNFINRDSILVGTYEEEDLKVFDSHMILTLTNELDIEHEEFIKNKLKNTEIIGVVEVDI